MKIFDLIRCFAVIRKNTFSILFLLFIVFSAFSCTFINKPADMNHYYEELDAIREKKYSELKNYLHFMMKKAEAVQNDPLFKEYFLQKNRIYQRLKNNELRPDDADKITLLRDKLEDHYINNYLNFYDVLFIQPDGDIFYTLRRQADYHKNIFMGELAETALSKELKNDKQFSYVDFQNYNFSGEPSAFFIEEFHQGEQFKGWFVLQFSINKINDIFSREDILGTTGEVFLVNRDSYMLTDSKFFPGSSVLRRHLSPQNIQSKFAEREGHKTVIDYRGQRAVTSFQVVEVLNSEWLLIVKIDEDEIISEIYRRNSREYRDKLLEAGRKQWHNYQSLPDTDLGRDAIEVDMDEFKRSIDDIPLYTHGVSYCTAVLLNKENDFAYMAHISPYDRIYGGKQTDLVGQMTRQIDLFEITDSEKQDLEILMVSPEVRYGEDLLQAFLDWGIFLSQIKVIHHPNARYANISYDPQGQGSIIEWQVNGDYFYMSPDDVKSLGQLMAGLFQADGII